MEPTKLEEATNEMQEAAAAMRKAQDDGETQLKSLGLDVRKMTGDLERVDGVTGDVKERMVKAEAAVIESEERWRLIDTELKAQAQLRGDLESKVDLALRSRPTDLVTEEKASAELYESAYSKVLHAGYGHDSNGHRAPTGRWALTEDEQKSMDDVEKKNLSSDSGETGGYLMPPAMRGDLIKKLIEKDPLEELAASVDLTSGDTWEAPREGDQNFECDWVGERETRGETTAGKIALERITAHELYAKPLVSQKMLDDPGFSVESWLTERLVRRFSVKRGQAFVSGDAVGKPEGIVASDTATGSGDFGYVPLGHASTINGTDGLWDLFIDLPEFYSSQSTWLWQRSTTGIVRKLKDGEDRNIWAPAFEGTPPTALDRPYRESISMPTVAANAFSVALGDWQSAYLVVRRQDVRTLRDPFSTKPFVEFYTTLRVGGMPVLNEAYRLGRVSTS